MHSNLQPNGWDKRITRRGFLNGTQVAIGAPLLSPSTKVFGPDASKSALGRTIRMA